MQSFVEVISFGSFSEAAKLLGLSRPLVSRHVTDLESHLGVRLPTRTTRRITLTEAGAAHFNFCQRVIQETEEQETSLKRTQKEPAGSLKILAPKSLTTLALGDAIASFAAAYPHLNINLMLDDLSFRSYDFIERGLMSQCIRRQFASRAWSPEKLPTCVGCFAHRRIISSSMAKRFAERSYAASMLAPLTRSLATDLASSRRGWPRFGKSSGPICLE